jgi:hypothetical protein
VRLLVRVGTYSKGAVEVDVGVFGGHLISEDGDLVELEVLEPLEEKGQVITVMLRSSEGRQPPWRNEGALCDITMEKWLRDKPGPAYPGAIKFGGLVCQPAAPSVPASP